MSGFNRKFRVYPSAEEFQLEGVVVIDTDVGVIQGVGMPRFLSSDESIAEPIVSGTVSIVNPGEVYDKFETIVMVTATGSVARVVLDIVGGAELWNDAIAPFSGPYIPSGVLPVTLRARGYDAADTLLDTAMLEVTPGTYAEGLAAAFAAIGTSGASQLFWAAPGVDYMTLAGSDVTQWVDLTGNAQHATDGTSRPVFVEVPGGNSYLDFTRPDDDRLVIPHTQANSATKYSWFVSFRSPGATSYNTITQLYAGAYGFTLQFYGNILWLAINGVAGYVSAVASNVDHAVLITYDGLIADPTKRVTIVIDDVPRNTDTSPNWPASLAASHSGGRIGDRATNDQAFTGRVHAVAQWYTEALTGTDVAALFNLMRDHLDYASTWTPTGTSLIENVHAAPAISDTPIPLTATGLTITVGTPVVVYQTTGAERARFTALVGNGDGTYDLYFRIGETHSSLDGKIMRVTSTSTWETWGVPVTFIDDVTLNDNDPCVGMIGGVETLLWQRSLDYADIYQLYSTPTAGGAVANVFGYPFIASAQKRISGTGRTLDNGNLITAYGGPDSIAGWLAIREAGTTVHWYPAATYVEGGVTKFARIYEPCAVHLQSGGYRLVARSGAPGTATGPVIHARSINGVDWTDWQFFPATHDGEPLGIDSPRRFQMSTGTHLIVGRRRYATNVPLVLLWSLDGETWAVENLLNLAATDGGYADIVEESSTRVVISYYAGGGTQICVVPVTIEATP